MDDSRAPIWNRGFSLLSASTLLLAIGFYFLLPILPSYFGVRLGAGNSEIGVLLSVYTLAAIVVRPLTGASIDRVQPRWILFGSLLAFALTMAFYPMVKSVSAMLVLRLVHGVTWGVATTTAATVVVEFIAPRRRGEGLGIYGLAMTLAMAIGPVIASTLLGFLDYAPVFFVAAALCLCAFALALPLRPAPRTRRIAFHWSNFIEPRALPVSGNLLLITFTYGGLLAFLPVYLAELGHANSGPFFMVLAVAIGLSRVFAGRIYDKRGPRVLTISGFSLLVAGFVSLAAWPAVPGVLLAMACIGLAFGIVMPTFQAMVNEALPVERRGAANSTYFTALDTGIGLGMLLTGIIAESMGLRVVYGIDAALGLLALALFLLWTFPKYARTT